RGGLSPGVLPQQSGSAVLPGGGGAEGGEVSQRVRVALAARVVILPHAARAALFPCTSSAPCPQCSRSYETCLPFGAPLCADSLPLTEETSMLAKRMMVVPVVAFVALLSLTLLVQAGQAGGEKKDEQKKEKKKARPDPVYTDLNDPKLPADFKFQGEWV